MLLFFVHNELRWKSIVICGNNLPRLSVGCLNRAMCCSQRQPVGQMMIKPVSVWECESIFVWVSVEDTCHGVCTCMVNCRLCIWMLVQLNCCFPSRDQVGCCKPCYRVAEHQPYGRSLVYSHWCHMEITGCPCAWRLWKIHINELWNQDDS